MQVVYVLISDENDYYYEQCLISVTSLIKCMPSCKIILLTDDKTYCSLVGKRELLKNIVFDIIQIEVQNNLKKKEISRFIKTSMRQYIIGDFLFIDCDTVICEPLDSIGSCKEDICAVMDNHTPLNQNVYAKDMLKRAKICSFHAGYKNIHYNSGVIWVRDSKDSYNFFNLWHKLWKEGKKKGILSDQLSFNEANYRLNGLIMELNGIWNCQVDFGMRYIHEAKIIHYLGFNPKDENSKISTLPYKLSSVGVLDDIKKSGVITKEIEYIIENPKGQEAFNSTFLINSNRAEVDIIHGALISCIRIPYNRAHWLYLGLDNFVRGVRTIWKHKIQGKEI